MWWSGGTAVTMHCLLLAGVAVLLSLPHLVNTQARPTVQPLTPNSVKPECRDRFFYIWGDKRFFKANQWYLETLNNTGFADLMEGSRAAQCGYTFTSDLNRNLEIRISYLGCWVENINDRRFNISMRFQLIHDGWIETYPINMSCTPERKWDVREIICEENYIEVSVRKVPDAIMQFLQLIEPVAETEMAQTWQVVFTNHFNGTISADDAINRGYGVNATLSRVVFRAPYNTPESQIVQVQDYNLYAIFSKMQYAQTLLLLSIDTTMACPNDPPLFTDVSLSWLSPAMLSPLITGNFLNSQFSMGINGRLLSDDQIQENHYIFQNSPSVVNVTVPIGAPGGNAESDVINNTYVTTYRINLVLRRQWLGKNKDDSTTHTQYKPVLNPAVKHTPIFIDHTMKEARYFNVSLGNFYSDVNVKSFIIHYTPLTLDVLEPRRMSFFPVINLNNTQVFYLIVPFSDPLVEQTYLGGYRRLYRLHVTYILTLVTKQKDFTYSDVVECVLEDVVPPEYTGSCGRDRLVLDMKRGNLDVYWVPYIRNIPLTNDLINSQHYVVQNTDANLHLEVPYPSAGLVYEVASLSGFHVRLDFSLLDNKTLRMESNFSVNCIFPPVSVCISNGTIITVVDGSLTKPRIDIQRTHLKDPTCKPQEANETMALFNFPVYTCGTTQKFDGAYLAYENEVTYDRAVLFPNQPIISRDSTYRLTVRCRYPLRANLSLGAQYKTPPLAMVGLALESQARVLRRRVRTHMAELKIAKDDGYTSFYHSGDFPVSVKPADSLYIQADVPSTVLVSLLQDCWATNFPSHDGKSQWDLVVDGCPTTGDALSTTILDSPDHSARLNVTFNGAVNGQVYIHCQVSLCDPMHTYGCFQTCNRTVARIFGKRATSVFSEVVSAGPIDVVSHNVEVGYQKLAGELWSSWSWILSIGLAVIAALAVGAIFLAVRLFVHQ